jgi:hypothetical protein
MTCDQRGPHGGACRRAFGHRGPHRYGAASIPVPPPALATLRGVRLSVTIRLDVPRLCVRLSPEQMYALMAGIGRCVAAGAALDRGTG